MSIGGSVSRWLRAVCAAAILLALGAGLIVALAPELSAGPFKRGASPSNCGPCADDGQSSLDFAGEWHWVRSPDEEKRAVAGYYNRYCLRCHGVDGRGVWDIPGVPDFTNVRWQESRTDAQLARIIIAGRGAVMPPFRGTLSLEEAWAIGRYLHTFVPGTEQPRPVTNSPKKHDAPPK